MRGDRHWRTFWAAWPPPRQERCPVVFRGISFLLEETVSDLDQVVRDLVSVETHCRFVHIPECKGECSKPEEQSFQCKAKPLATADPPQDCDWPLCGCDPYAEKVIAALQESGWLMEYCAKHPNAAHETVCLTCNQEGDEHIDRLRLLAYEEAKRRHNQDRDQELDRDGHDIALDQRHPGRFETCSQSDCWLFHGDA